MSKEFVYDSKILSLSLFSRLFVKVLILAFFVVGAVAIFMFLLPGSGKLVYAGMLLLAFYFDRLLHVLMRDTPLSKDLPRTVSGAKKPFNIEPYFYPRAKSLLIKS